MNTGKLIKTLLIITSIIVILNIIDELIGHPSWQVERLIGVGYEGNFPTWFSSMLLAIAAYFSYKCSVLAKDGKRVWKLLALGLIFMSCDEVAQIHEHFGSTLHKYFFNNMEAIKHSSWVVILGPAVLLIVLIFAFKMKKYLKGSKQAVKFLLLGAFVYIFGAFILETATNLLNHENLEWLWRIENILEESCEMFGVILIIKGLMKHLKFLSGETTEEKHRDCPLV